jgi:hypothetical protein
MQPERAHHQPVLRLVVVPGARAALARAWFRSARGRAWQRAAARVSREAARALEAQAPEHAARVRAPAQERLPVGSRKNTMPRPATQSGTAAVGACRKNRI